MKFQKEKEWLEMNLITKKCRLSRIEYFESGYFCIEYYLEDDSELKFKATDIDWIKSAMRHEETMREKSEEYKLLDDEEKASAMEMLEKQKQELSLF